MHLFPGVYLLEPACQYCIVYVFGGLSCFLVFGHRGAYKLQIDVINGILAFPVEFSDGLADIVGIGVFLPIELIPSYTHRVFGKVPSIGKVDRLYNTVDNGHRMGGVPCPQDVHFPVFPGHLIKVLSFDLAHLEADNAVDGLGTSG